MNCEFLRAFSLLFRDNASLECDTIIHLPNGKWGVIEIKLKEDSLINDGVASLNKSKIELSEKSDEVAPSFMMILTTTGPAYQRDDGIYIVPIICLEP